MVTALGQVDGFLDGADPLVAVVAFALGDCVLEFFGPAEQMALALAFLVVEDGVGGEASDDQLAVEIGAENFFGDGMTTITLAGAHGVDSECLGNC